MDAEATGKRARLLFESGFYCAESVIKAVAEARGVDSDIVPGVATGFCSGQARTCGQCGAISGAVMSVGMILGRRSPDDSIEIVYEAVREVLSRFTEKYESTNCERLLGCDLGTEEGQEKFESMNLHEWCLDYTEEAARIVMEVIDLYDMK